eukprot:GEMP01051047.1.p1 GENE.GEMP01051047.1~~GEMP01051047.1.p1  ORF type:complete len:492 (+),score=136.72 GEMP01051047.1:62-1537(+)
MENCSFYGLHALRVSDDETEASEAKEALKVFFAAPALGLTNGEKKLASKMLEEQIKKCANAKASEALTALLSRVKQTPPTPDSKLVVRTQKKIKDLATEIFEFEEIEDKWKKGRHQFKTTAALSDFKRDQREAEKNLKKTEEKLEQILRRKRLPEDEEEVTAWTRPAPTKAKAKPLVKRPGAFRTQDLTLEQQLQAKMVAQLKSDEGAEDGEPKKKEEMVSVWDTGKAGKTRPGQEKSIFGQNEFPDVQAQAPATKAPPKAPRRRKEANESSSESSSSEEEIRPQQPTQPREGKSAAKAKAKESAAPAVAKKKVKSKEKQDDQYLNKQSKKAKGATAMNQLMNYVNRCYQESFLGSGNVEMLWMSPLGLPGKWTPIMNLVWNPPLKQTQSGYKMVEPLGPRVRKNVKLLWPRYLEVLMFFYFAMALSTFGFFSIITTAQIILSRIKAVPTTLITLNHYLIWILYFRNLLMMSLPLKALSGTIFAAHVLLFS